MKSVEDFAKEEGYNENTIWNAKQNHPDLVVQDLKGRFGLTGEQCKRDQKNKTLREMLNEMQNIAKMPRWVEWGRYHKHRQNSLKEIKVKGRKC